MKDETAVPKLLVVLSYQETFGPIPEDYAVNGPKTTGTQLFDELLKSDPYFPTWVKLKWPSLLKNND